MTKQVRNQENTFQAKIGLEDGKLNLQITKTTQGGGWRTRVFSDVETATEWILRCCFMGQRYATKKSAMGDRVVTAKEDRTIHHESTSSTEWGSDFLMPQGCTFKSNSSESEFVKNWYWAFDQISHLGSREESYRRFPEYINLWIEFMEQLEEIKFDSLRGGTMPRDIMDLGYTRDHSDLADNNGFLR